MRWRFPLRTGCSSPSWATAGPGYHLSQLSAAWYTGCLPGRLAQPSPYLPGPRYPEDWAQRHEEPPGPDRTFLPGTLTIAHHGCSLVTQL
jgi:hypothetical protein